MKAYIKFISTILVLVFALTGVSLFGVGAESTYTQPEKFIYGDVDLDGNVTVKDATLIQKGLAKITYVTAVQRCLADPLGTGYSVKNATAIQKYLAKYETETPWGTELIMASQDEFSGAVSNNSKYADTTILLMFKTDHTTEYTLNDFPEYAFESINRITELKPHIYILTLSNPSKENVMEAIKALDYRANIDLLNVSPNYIYTLD